MRCEGVDHGSVDWDYDMYEKSHLRNGIMVPSLGVNLAMQRIYQDAKSTPTHMNSNPIVRVHQVYYSSNDESYRSLNDPLSANSRDDTSSSSDSSHDNSAGNSRQAPKNEIFVHGRANTNGSKEVGAGISHKDDIKNDQGKSVVEWEAEVRGGVIDRGNGRPEGQVEGRVGVRF